MYHTDRKNMRSKSESSQYKTHKKEKRDSKDRNKDLKDLNLDNHYERRPQNYDDLPNAPLDYNHDNYYDNYDDYKDYNYDDYYSKDNKPKESDERLLKEYLDRKDDLKPKRTLKGKNDDLYDSYYYDEISNNNSLDYDDYLRKNKHNSSKTDDINDYKNSYNDEYNDSKDYDNKDYYSKDYYNDDNYYDDYKDDYKDYKNYGYKDSGDNSKNYYNYTNYIYNNYFYNDNKYNHLLNKYNTKKGSRLELKNGKPRKIELNILKEEIDMPDPKLKLKFESNSKKGHNYENHLYNKNTSNYLKKPLNDRDNEFGYKIGKTISEKKFNFKNKYNSKTANSNQYRTVKKSNDFIYKDSTDRTRGTSFSQKGPKNKIYLNGSIALQASKDNGDIGYKYNNTISSSYSSAYPMDININDSSNNIISSRDKNNHVVEIKSIKNQAPKKLNKDIILNSRIKSENDNKSNIGMVSITNKKGIDKSILKIINDITNNNKDSNNNKTTQDITNNKENNTDKNTIDNKENNNSNDTTIKSVIKNNNDNKDKNNIMINSKNSILKTNSSLKINDKTIHLNNKILDLSKNKKVENLYSSLTNLNNIKNSILRTFTKKECEKCHKQIETHLYKIHCNAHPTEIFRWLYLGTFENACDLEELKRIKVTHILNCATECKNTNLPSDIKELHLNINDYEGFEIYDYFEQANEFLNNCKEDVGIALVHCKYGISRSVAFVIAYFIKYLKFSADSALEYLMQKRSKIKPNDGFMEQLREYERAFAP